MIPEKNLRAEYRRYPKFIKDAIRQGDLEEALRLQHNMETIEWILEGDL